MKPTHSDGSCPKCNSTCVLITPRWLQGEQIYSCPVCGNIHHPDGKTFVHDTKELYDVFHAVTKTEEIFKGIDDLDPALSVVTRARLYELASTMWFEGLKQGLMIGVHKYGKVRSE